VIKETILFIRVAQATGKRLHLKISRFSYRGEGVRAEIDADIESSTGRTRRGKSHTSGLVKEPGGQNR
jgi:hypothetical protein